MKPHNAPSWTVLLRRLAPDAEMRPPATNGVHDEIERSLGVALPAVLRAFLEEIDGLADDYGSGVIWPAAEIVMRNREFRSERSFVDLYMPFDNLLFFGDDGGGDQFAFAIHADSRIHKGDIYRWEHETDARSWYASHLQRYIEARLAGGDDA